MGILNNNWEGIREEPAVVECKNCVFVFLEALRKTTNPQAGIVV
jgi:hypothetical protein